MIFKPNNMLVLVTGLTVLAAPDHARAGAPCGDLGECKALVEINSSDGDIGFHFLMDGDHFHSAMLTDPNDEVIFSYLVEGPLAEQTLTETFAESAEPLCFDPRLDDDPENDDEDFRTLTEFLDLWTAGTYRFSGLDDDEELAEGETELTFRLPAAPADLEYDDGSISWAPGNDLGECADAGELAAMVPSLLPVHPEDVVVDEWEVVLETDVEDDDPRDGKKFTARIPGDAFPLEISVPAEFLAALPQNTPAKIEVGAIGGGDNATFTEEGDICLNETVASMKRLTAWELLIYFHTGELPGDFEAGCDFDDDEDGEDGDGWSVM